MKSSNTNTKLALRDFAVTLAVGMPVFFTVLPWFFKHRFHAWPLAVGPVFGIWGWLHPASLAPVRAAWMKLGAGLGWLNTRVILVIVYYGTIVPAGLLFRIFRKKESLKFRAKFRGPDLNLATYRVPSRQYTPESMERPF